MVMQLDALSPEREGEAVGRDLLRRRLALVCVDGPALRLRPTDTRQSRVELLTEMPALVGDGLLRAVVWNELAYHDAHPAFGESFEASVSALGRLHRCDDSLDEWFDRQWWSHRPELPRSR